MAISTSLLPISSFLLLLLMFLTNCTMHANGCYTSVISFGDSLTDTGNLKEIFSKSSSDGSSSSNDPPPYYFFPPYGETFFHEATGRCSDGRLIVDFIAEGLGMLQIVPYERIKTKKVMEIGQGLNFAVVSATALDPSFHEAQGVRNPYTNSSLGSQVESFKQLLASICLLPSDCKNILENSLILMGEIGGNDYNNPVVLAGKSFDEINWYVPLVINAIASAIIDLINLGAKTFVVPGNLPIGCSAAYLTIYHDSNEARYDNKTGCLIELNKFTEYHNKLLQKALNQIRELHPHVNIVYADYYNAAMQFYRSPKEFGFTNGALSTCCGGGGPYNYNLLERCGDPSSTTCDLPKTYVNWDGLHLTEAAYHVIYKSVFQGTYATPQLNSLCHTLISKAKDASLLVQSF